LINQRSRQHRRGRRPLPTRVGRQCTPNRSVMVSAASPTTRRLVRRATHAARSVTDQVAAAWMIFSSPSFTALTTAS
jgi:hypothetical protein